MENLIKITIEIRSMRNRDLLDKFTKRQEKKLKIIPKYIDGNFIRLKYWITEKKGFNRNPKGIRVNFWKELRAFCKRHRIYYDEHEVKQREKKRLKNR